MLFLVIYLAETLFTHKQIRHWIDVLLKFNNKEKWEEDYICYKYLKKIFIKR